MSRENQAPWPRKVADKWEPRSPTGRFQTPDTILRSDRSLAGPLRMGTASGVGPRGALRGGNTSDFGMDRITPRGFDPIGNSLTFAPSQEESTLVSRDVRRGKRRSE